MLVLLEKTVKDGLFGSANPKYDVVRLLRRSDRARPIIKAHKKIHRRFAGKSQHNRKQSGVIPFLQN
ncbi:hypothetical protein AWC14_02805 [Mycobacterium kyorinense]|uniref:Uncharacterized protein n=1 Tax=Mycobacterium kyorinense TaxID=487514 RepID=A0A1X1Y0K1_9MYCO|nr:hypothetical protein AWC14_02805 [Mycobacterium kyorinense]